MKFMSESRALEGIVPAEHRVRFGLVAEDEVKFNLASSPKKGIGDEPPADTGGETIDPAAGDDASPADAPQPGEGKATDADRAKWLVKKLVGTLKYAGAMATEVRGSMPDEAVEVIEKLVEDLESMQQALSPYVTEEPDTEEPDTEETDEPETDDEQAPGDEGSGEGGSPLDGGGDGNETTV